MVAKRTKSGKLSIALSFHQRAMLEWHCDQYVDVSQFKNSFKTGNEMGVYAAIYYATINQFLIRTNWQLKLMQTKKIILTIPEGLAVMWMLRLSGDIDMIDLKSALHKTLTK